MDQHEKAVTKVMRDFRGYVKEARQLVNKLTRWAEAANYGRLSRKDWLQAKDAVNALDVYARAASGMHGEAFDVAVQEQMKPYAAVIEAMEEALEEFIDLFYLYGADAEEAAKAILDEHPGLATQKAHEMAWALPPDEQSRLAYARYERIMDQEEAEIARERAERAEYEAMIAGRDWPLAKRGR